MFIRLYATTWSAGFHFSFYLSLWFLCDYPTVSNWPRQQSFHIFLSFSSYFPFYWLEKQQTAVRSSQLRSHLTHFSFVLLEKSGCPVPCMLWVVCLLFLLRDSGVCFPNEVHTHHIHTYKFHNKPQWNVLIKSINSSVVCVCVKYHLRMTTHQKVFLEKLILSKDLLYSSLIQFIFLSCIYSLAPLWNLSGPTSSCQMSIISLPVILTFI